MQEILHPYTPTQRLYRKQYSYLRGEELNGG